MKIPKQQFISLGDVYLAYRKAKIEAFYDGSQFDAVAFTQYEQKLHSNLKQLLIRINDPLTTWASDCKFLGGFSYAPKSLDNPTGPDDGEIFFRALNPIDDWKQSFKRQDKVRIGIDFRLMMIPSIDLQIISALWILKVGHFFDERLDGHVCFANRLRRHGIHTKERKAATSGEINNDSLGLFPPYFSAYQKWRESGLSRMRKSLESGEKIIAVTMDLRSFYHRVDPNFLLRRSFLDAIGLTLTADETKFTKNFLDAINTWYRQTPDFANRPKGALPVGLSASKIIANVLLFDLDQLISNRLKPIHYGRYVDDIFLVVKQTDEIFSGEEFMEYLAQSSNGLLRFEKSAKEGASLQLQLPYGAGCDLVFAGSKQKIFLLSSEHGLDLVEQISEQIRRRSSEYRLLSLPPSTGSEMAAKALMATPDAALEADALRKADVVSVRRLGFASLLGDMESYARDLQARSWRGLRFEFYGLVYRHLLTPRGVFDLVSYIHRVFGLMIACGDLEHAETFIERLNSVLRLLKNTTTAEDDPIRYKYFLKHYAGALAQSALQATTERNFSFSRRFILILNRIKEMDSSLVMPKGLTAAKALSVQLLRADWGRRAYKDYWYYSQLEDIRGPSIPKSLSVLRLIRLGGIRNYQEAADLRIPFWPALAFPTRPLTVPEITLFAPKLLSDSQSFRAAIMALRGARVSSDTDIGFIDQELPPRYFQVPEKQKGKLRIAVTNFETTDAQWAKAVKRRPDTSLRRHKLIAQLVNRILEERPKPNYLVFPECSIPRRWALSIAGKLATNGISLLAGLEYYRKRGKTRNDCLVSLTTSWPGYDRNVIFLQPKFAPSHEERKQLLRLANATLYRPTGIESIPPVYAHGNFNFSVLLCSDLTNIENRKYLRGNVDALFVLEWNPDISTFSFLVESTAHDMHAFVLQVNNRQYGDSRVRAPFRIEHKRDLVRVKGGMTDYYVMAEIDFQSLRRFQKLRSPSSKSEFKPVPIGFKISKHR